MNILEERQSKKLHSKKTKRNEVVTFEKSFGCTAKFVGDNINASLSLLGIFSGSVLRKGVSRGFRGGSYCFDRLWTRSWLPRGTSPERRHF